MESTTAQHSISPALWEKALSYPQYRKLIEQLLDEGKTTGPNQSEELTQYTRMNVQRMGRIDKQAVLDSALAARLQQIATPMRWLVLTEGWCGDAAQIIPWLQKMAEGSALLEIKFLLRDEHTELMDQFLTNGGRAIPKLIALDAQNMTILGDWGPRPAAAQSLYMGLKAAQTPFLEASTQLHKWYADNKGADIQSELAAAIQNWQVS